MKNYMYRYLLRHSQPEKDPVQSLDSTRTLNDVEERLLEFGRQDNTTIANISVTIYTTVEFRLFNISFLYENN